MRTNSVIPDRKCTAFKMMRIFFFPLSCLIVPKATPDKIKTLWRKQKKQQNNKQNCSRTFNLLLIHSSCWVNFASERTRNPHGPRSHFLCCSHGDASHTSQPRDDTIGPSREGGGVVARGFQHGSRSENGAWSPVSLLPLIPFSVIKWRNSIQWLLRDLISAPTSGSTQCLGVMSDSEDESQDKQLKVVVIGDGACGKVRTSTVGPIVGRGRWGKRACWKKETALAARLVLPCWTQTARALPRCPW